MVILTLPSCQTAEQLLITTLRLLRRDWQESDAGPVWYSGLQAAGLARNAIDAFSELFFLTATSSPRPLHIHALHCVCVGCDEIALLRMIALLQRDQEENAAAAIDRWLPRAAVRVILSYATTVAQALSFAGLRLPLRHAEFGQRHLFAHANSGLTLVQ